MVSPKRKIALEGAARERVRLQDVIGRHGLKQRFIAKKVRVGERSLSSFLTKPSYVLSEEAMKRLRHFLDSVSEQEKFFLMSDPEADLVLMGESERNDTEQDAAKPKHSADDSGVKADEAEGRPKSNVVLTPRQRLMNEILDTYSEAKRAECEGWLGYFDDTQLEIQHLKVMAFREASKKGVLPQ